MASSGLAYSSASRPRGKLIYIYVYIDIYIHIDIDSFILTYPRGGGVEQSCVLLGLAQFSIQEQLLCIMVKRFRAGIVFKAHRLSYHSTLGLRVIEKKKSCQLEKCLRRGAPSGRWRRAVVRTPRCLAPSRTASPVVERPPNRLPRLST